MGFKNCSAAANMANDVKRATPTEQLLSELHDPSTPKPEREHAAVEEIERKTRHDTKRQPQMRLGKKMTRKRPMRVIVSAYDPLGDVFVGGFNAAYDSQRAANGHYTRQIANLLPGWTKWWCGMRTPYVRVGFVWDGGGVTGHINKCYYSG